MAGFKYILDPGLASIAAVGNPIKDLEETLKTYREKGLNVNNVESFYLSILLQRDQLGKLKKQLPREQYERIKFAIEQIEYQLMILQGQAAYKKKELGPTIEHMKKERERKLKEWEGKYRAWA